MSEVETSYNWVETTRYLPYTHWWYYALNFTLAYKVDVQGCTCVSIFPSLCRRL